MKHTNAQGEGESKTYLVGTIYFPMSQGAHCANWIGMKCGFVIYVRRLSGSNLTTVVLTNVSVREGNPVLEVRREEIGVFGTYR